MATMTGTRIETPDSPIAWIEEDLSANPPAPKGVYLVVDPDDGRCQIETRHSVDGTSEAAWHGRLIEFPVAAGADAIAVANWINGTIPVPHAYNALAARVRTQDMTFSEADIRAANAEFGALLDRIVAGYEARWDGSNAIGAYTDDADDAAETIRERLADWSSMDEGGFAEAADWYADADDDAVSAEYGITAETDDDTLWEISARMEADERARGDVVLARTYQYAARLRDRARDAEQDA